DVVCFKSLSQNYSTELDTHNHKTLGWLPVDKADFFSLFWPAWVGTFTESLVLTAFEATGIHPPNATRTSTFPGQRKVDIYRFFVKIRLKCLLKSVSQRPLSAAGVVAGALASFVFQLFAELKSLQNGPCATQIFTFGRRPQPPPRQGDSPATPCSCNIRALPGLTQGSPREELRHNSTEHRLSTPTTTRAACSSLKTDCQRP
ncbi:hypothetical protein EJ07DRAFT_99380, partial [Lizonia empirigonia]